MNARIATLCFVATFASPCFGDALLTLDSLQLKDGRKYQKVTITKQNDDGITFSHAEGLARIDYQELPNHVAKRLGLTPLDDEGYKMYQINQARLKAEKIETLKAQEAERRRQKALELEEAQRRQAAYAESQRIAAQQAAEEAARRRREQEIAQARERQEAERREQEMLRINPNYKRVQQLQQMRDRISQQIENIPPMRTAYGDAAGGFAWYRQEMEKRNEMIAQLGRELRVIDNQILLLTPGRTDEQNRQLAQQMELENQQEHARQQQKAMQEQLAKQAAQMRAETEKMRRDMEAMQFQQEQNDAYQRRRMQEMEQQRQWDNMNRRTYEFMNR